MLDYNSLEDAGKEFKRRFMDKTKNKWENKDNFIPEPGKYTLLRMDDPKDVSEDSVIQMI